MKPNLNTLTKRANSVIERRIPIPKVKTFLDEKYPSFMETFKDYDLKIKYENEITIILICQNKKAIFENM
ncbi:hypothetical protein CRU96_06960 [Malaciobacter halophilus]|nr:hypothetical protein [Malaciobacter halophilus]RYA23612.1 hypothetical protein CRU96_06960 [Malaciobacter halophilus]